MKSLGDQMCLHVFIAEILRGSLGAEPTINHWRALIIYFILINMINVSESSFPGLKTAAE